MRLDLQDAHSVITNEIEQGGGLRDVAQTYALALRSSAPFDCAKANQAILARWSFAGLVAIKKAAWSGKWRGGLLFSEPVEPAEVAR